MVAWTYCVTVLCIRNKGHGLEISIWESSQKSAKIKLSQKVAWIFNHISWIIEIVCKTSEHRISVVSQSFIFFPFTKTNKVLRIWQLIKTVQTKLPVNTIILVICFTFLWLLYLLEEQLFSYLIVISFYYNPQLLTWESVFPEHELWSHTAWV